MTVRSTASLAELLDFLDRLEAHHIHYRLEHNRPESITVLIAVPGERWEAEFMEDGQVEVERFTSDGSIAGGETLEKLFALHGRPGADRS